MGPAPRHKSCLGYNSSFCSLHILEYMETMEMMQPISKVYLLLAQTMLCHPNFSAMLLVITSCS